MKARKIIFCFLIYLLILSNNINAQTANFLWVKQLGGTGDDIGNSITVDVNGNVYTTGSFSGTADFNPGTGIYNLSSTCISNVFISKLDASGNFLWAKQFGGNGDIACHSIAVDANGNVYTTGSFSGTADFDPDTGTYDLSSTGSSNVFISKLDASGNFLWAKQFGGSSYSDAISYSMAVDVNGNVYTTGSFYGTVDFDPGTGIYNLSSWGSGGYAYNHIFVSKLDTSGGFLWAKQFGDLGSFGNSIAVDANGNVYTTGYFSGTADFDPGAGTYNLSSTGSSNVFISKLDALGNFLWAKQFANHSEPNGTSIAVDANGNVYTTGSFSGMVDFDPGTGTYYLTSVDNEDVFVSKLDALGNFLWVKQFGGNGGITTHSIAVDANGNVYTTGPFSGTADFDPGAGTHYLTSVAGNEDIFVSKLDVSGNFLWAKQFGGSSYSNPNSNSIAVDAIGSIYTTGSFYYTVDFDPGTGIYNLTSTGSADIFVMKLKQNNPVNIAYPKETLSAGSINAGQSITISGYDFKPNGTANLNIYGDNGFSQTISNINIDAQSSFVYNFVTATSMPLGIYNVQVTDNTTGLTTPARSFTLNTATVQTAYLNITSPTQTFTMNANEGLVIEWKDKMIKGGNYPLTGSQRNYKYTIELSSDNGSTWNTLGTMAGQDYIDSWIMLHYYPSITTPGSNYKIRITDFYNNSNSQTTPAFTVNSNTYTGNLQVNLMWDRSYPQPSAPVAGIAADGTARIFLNLSKINSSTGPNISSVSVTLSDILNGSDPAKLGRVKVATQTSSYSLEANGIQSIADVDNTPNKSNYIFWYVGPDDFAGADPEDIKNGSRFVTATFTVHYDNSTIESFTKHIIIVRPPLALVHGLASDPSAWDNFTFTAPSGLHYQYLDSKNFLFKVVSALTILPDAHFNTNALGLITPNSSMQLSQTNTLQGLIDSMRDQGYAANQVDYIAHSMGGNVIRQAILFTDAFKVVGTLASSPYKNYEMGFVHKIITLNTPHNGSPWADLISQKTPFLELNSRRLLSSLYFSWRKIRSFVHPIGNYNFLTLSFDKFEATDAIEDLEVGAPGVNMMQTNIPSHLIAGDVFENSSAIDSTVWNAINQIPHFTDFLNYYWETIRALETDQGKKAQLNVFKSMRSDAERAVKFLDYYISEYLNTPNFVLHGDFVVPLISQTAGSQTAGRQTSDPNVDVYSGTYAWHLDITQDLEVGDRVLQLINSPVGGPLFNNIPASSNTSALNKNSLFKKSSIQSSAAMISAIDTTKIKILSPTNFSNYTTDSTLIIKTQIKDTAGLQYVELYFQGKNYLTDSINSFINFNVQVKGDFLENQQIVATAVYDVTDTSKFLSDTVDVNVSIVQPVQSFTASPEMIFLLKNQTIYPDYYATYSTFVTKVGNNNSKIKVTINDPNIVSQDLLLLGFTGKNDGETFAVIEYGGFSYTLYFVVGGTASILPVELTSFTASTDSDKILLNWQTATEVNNYGFDVERRIIEKTEWSKIAFIQGNGTSNIPHNYSYTDHSLTSGSYVYRLKQIDNNGKIKYSQETEVTFKVPRVFALSQNYPNPFNPTTVINYQLPVNSFVTLKIYDVLGREIATLINGKQNAGYYKASFNASSLSSGVYFYRLQAGSFTETKKLILLR